MIDIDGVVGGLGELVEYADAAVRLGCGAEYCESEVVFRYYLRAGEGEEYAARCDFFDS